MIIEETLRITIEAHEGQKDLDGRPAVLHPIAVGLMGCNDAETKTGFLHDVVEDSDLTMDELRGRGVDEDVLAALRLLTHASVRQHHCHSRQNERPQAQSRKGAADLCAGCGGRRHGKGGASVPHQRQAPQGSVPAGDCPYSTSVKQKLSTSTSLISVSLSEGMTGRAMNDKVMKGA